MQVKRSLGRRLPVEVETSLELPGMSVMELLGVVYHAGASLQTGHYVCAVRDAVDYTRSRVGAEALASTASRAARMAPGRRSPGAQKNLK